MLQFDFLCIMWSRAVVSLCQKFHTLSIYLSDSLLRKQSSSCCTHSIRSISRRIGCHENIVLSIYLVIQVHFLHLFPRSCVWLWSFFSESHLYYVTTRKGRLRSLFVITMHVCLQALCHSLYRDCRQSFSTTRLEWRKRQRYQFGCTEFILRFSFCVLRCWAVCFDSLVTVFGV